MGKRAAAALIYQKGERGEEVLPLNELGSYTGRRGITGTSIE
jgi:hypothetical protein